MEPSPFEILLKDDESFEQLSELTQGSIKQLLYIIDSLRKGLNHDETCINNEEILNQNITLSAQLHEIQAELMRLSDKNSHLSQEISKMTTDNEDLRIVNDRLSVRVSSYKGVTNCKCPCKCGARDKKNSNEEIKDAGEFKEEMKTIMLERDRYRKMLDEDTIGKFCRNFENNSEQKF